MFSTIYSSGGINVPHPMYMPLQSFPNGISRLPYVPPIQPFSFSPFAPNNLTPRYPNGVFGGRYSGEGPPQLRKLFIGGLSHETTDEQLRQYYSQWGSVVDCIVIRDPQTKYSRGFGFVTFATIQMAEAAMSNRPHTINNKVVDPKRAIPREQMSPLLPNHPPPFLEIEPDPGCKLSVAGIHWAWHTVDDLRQYFDRFGTVEQVEILGSPRGLGFVVYENKASADRCLEYGKIHMINCQRCEVTRFPIEHSIYQRSDVYPYVGNDVEELDEQINFASASMQEMPDNSFIKTLENDFASNLNLETGKGYTLYDMENLQNCATLQNNAWDTYQEALNMSSLEGGILNAKFIKDTVNDKNGNEKRDMKTAKTDKKK